MGIWIVKNFSYSFSVYSCHLFLISFASVRSIPFLSFIEPIFAWNVPLVEKAMTSYSSTLAWKMPWMEEPRKLQSMGLHRLGHDWSELAAAAVPLVSLIFLKRSLVFPSLFFSSISLHWSLREAFLSQLAILWNSAFKWVYLFFSPLLFVSLLFTVISKTSLLSPMPIKSVMNMCIRCSMSWLHEYNSWLFLIEILNVLPLQVICWRIIPQMVGVCFCYIKSLPKYCNNFCGKWNVVSKVIRMQLSSAPKLNRFTGSHSEWFVFTHMYK